MIWPPNDNVPSYLFKSDDLPAPEARDRLRERFAANFDLILPADVPIRVDGAEHRGLMLGGMALLWRKMYVHGLARSPALIRSSQIDHYLLTISLAQRGPSRHVIDDALVVEQRAGEPLLLDMARPMRSDIESGTDATLFIPRDSLDELLPRRLDLHGIKPLGAVAALLADHLRILARDGAGLRPAEAMLLSRSTLHLVAASLAPLSDSIALARPQVEHLLVRRIGRHVDAHLADPELSVEQLCTAFQLSRSSLYRLFEPMGGVAAFIRERRLSRAHQLLAGAQERVPLKRLVGDFGFRSPAHFSRAFYGQYGYKPSEAREQIAPLAESMAPARSDSDRFASWLHSLNH